MASCKSNCFILVFLFIASYLWAGQPPSKQTITTGVVKFPVGTTITPIFKVPTGTTGTLTVQLDCDPTISFTMKIDESFDDGVTWTCDKGASCRSFPRNPAPCTNPLGQTTLKIGASWSQGDANGNLVPFADTTKIRGIITTNKAFTAQADFIFDVNP